MQEIIMINFVQFTEHDVHMYAKFEGLYFYAFFVNKYPKDCFIEIL
jgi:hypothetical protein